MLRGLSIQNVVLIQALELEFKSGLIALTGETGAGKSIILDALAMATGARSDRGLLRSGAHKAQVAAVFEVGAVHKVWSVVQDAALDMLPGESLILRRTLMNDGRSRAFINDAPVSVKLLQTVGNCLLEVHGQHDGRGLLDSSRHIEFLDMFADLQEDVAACVQAYEMFIQARAHLQSLTDQQVQADTDRDYYEHAVSEIDRLDPQTGELAGLVQKRQFLQGAEGALSELSAAEQALNETTLFESQIARAVKGIERVQERFSTLDDQTRDKLQAASTSLEQVMLEAQEARAAIATAMACFDIRPEQLEMLEERLFALRAAARKYDTQSDQLLEIRADFSEKLTVIGNIEADLQVAQSHMQACEDRYELCAGQLTESRQQAAQDLKRAVMAELPALKMERADFSVDIRPTEARSIGRDKVNFTAATNPGSRKGGLEKIASGGELARFALVIKVSLADRQESVMVFDEIDQGIGGAVADVIGKRLLQLATRSQVFVVTHSPQIAAHAQHQFRIEKTTDGMVTTTHVHNIEAADREEEIARMLAGEVVTQEARAAARQLLGSL